MARVFAAIAAWLVLVVGFCAGAAYGAEATDILFDMGPAGSPVASGAVAVGQDATYGRARGHGWLNRPATGFSDESGLSKKADRHYPLHLVQPGKDLYRDGFEDDKPITFRADVPPGEYFVTIYVGRYRHPRHDLRIRINDALVAEDVDAWGGVWGSQGGTPVKSVKVPVRTADGAIRVAIDYKASAPDSWKQYTSRRPEGGVLWYLGRNKSSILGLRIRSAVIWPVHRRGGKLHAPGLDAAERAVVAALNRNDTARAAALLEALPGRRKLRWAVLADTIAGHLHTPDEKRLELLAASLKALRAIRPASVAVRERIEVDERVLTALRYVRMWCYSQAGATTGMNGYKRYWGAYECCNPVAPNDPLYALSLLLRTRVAYWNGREGGWKHCYGLARTHALAMQQLDPSHPLVRMYLGQTVRHTYPARPAPPDAPRWAVLQREAIGRMRGVVRYWVEHRQAANGELGGGWGDDVEILRNWTPLVLATSDPVACRGAAAIADGVCAAGIVRGGYAAEVGDVEHAAEPCSDTQPLMVAVRFGEPKYFERCLATMRCMRDVWTGRTKAGRLHFKSHYFSATRTVDAPPRSADVPLNARAAKPGIWVVWYSGHPVVRRMLADWCRAWVAAARSTARGKPLGIIPGSVSFPDGRIGGYADEWWQTKGYDDLDAMGYTSKLYHLMLAVWAETRDDSLLEPLFAAMAAARAVRGRTGGAFRPGSLEWVGRLHQSGKVFDVLEKWRLLSGDKRFDDLLLPRATGTTRFRLSGDASRLEGELRGAVEGLARNLPMITTEVLFTDRAGLPGSDMLMPMLTGSAGNPTYYPIHAVTWQGVGDSAAAFVTGAERTSLDVMLYSFADGPHRVTARLWRLEPGTYEVVLAADSPAEAPLLRRSLKLWEKGTPLAIDLPPRRPLRLSLRQTARRDKPALLPDLAIGPDDVRRTSPGRLSVTVHNLGTKRSSAFQVRVSMKGSPAQTIACRPLDAPLDLAPKTTTVRATMPRSAQAAAVRVEIDPGNKVMEMYELNNVLEIPAVGGAARPAR